MKHPQEHSTPHQVSAPPCPYIEARVLNLEEEHVDLRGEVDSLKDLYHDLCNSFGKVQEGGRAVHSGPTPDMDLDKSRRSAMQFKDELEQLSREVRESMNGDADAQKANGHSTSKANGSVPQHARPASATSHRSGTTSVPPHLRGGKKPGPVNSNMYVGLFPVTYGYFS